MLTKVGVVTGGKTNNWAAATRLRHLSDGNLSTLTSTISVRE